VSTPDAEEAGDTHTPWWLRLLLSLVFGAGLLYALVTWADGLQLWPRRLDVKWWVVPAYLATLVPYFALRAGRWHMLVRPLDPGLRLWTTTRVSLAGIMWIMVMPLRLGEFARPLFLRQCSRVGFSPALGTVALERVVDGLLVCAMYFAAVAIAGVAPPGDADRAAELAALRVSGMVATGALSLVLVVLLLMAIWPAAVGRLVGAPLRRIAPPLADRVEGLARGVAEGLAALPSARAVGGFLAVTIVYWAINAVGMWVLARGCGLPLDLVQTTAVMAVLGLALLAPSGPAQLGAFQFGAVLGMQLFVDPATIADRGSVYVFLLYPCQLGAGVALGLWAQASLRLRWREVLGARAPSTGDR
jgi:uncharacterized membrane protein YbhN (UPF0104 family)